MNNNRNKNKRENQLMKITFHMNVVNLLRKNKQQIDQNI